MAKKPVQKKPATPIIPIAGAIVKALVKSGIAKKVAESAVGKALAKPRFNLPKSTPKAPMPKVTGKPGGKPPQPPKRTTSTGTPRSTEVDKAQTSGPNYGKPYDPRLDWPKSGPRNGAGYYKR